MESQKRDRCRKERGRDNDLRNLSDIEWAPMSLEIMWAPLDSMSGSMSETKLDPKSSNRTKNEQNHELEKDKSYEKMSVKRTDVSSQTTHWI